MDLGDLENRLEKDKLRDIILREHAGSTGESLGATRAAAAVDGDTPPIHASDNDEGGRGGNGRPRRNVRRVPN